MRAVVPAVQLACGFGGMEEPRPCHVARRMSGRRSEAIGVVLSRHVSPQSCPWRAHDQQKDILSKVDDTMMRSALQRLDWNVTYQLCAQSKPTSADILCTFQLCGCSLAQWHTRRLWAPTVPPTLSAGKGQMHSSHQSNAKKYSVKALSSPLRGKPTQVRSLYVGYLDQRRGSIWSCVAGMD